MMEQVLERIAVALESSVEIAKKDLDVRNEMVDLYRELVESRVGGTSTAAAVQSNVAETAQPDDRKAREEEYEKLKNELTARGVEIPPRTKLTTLQKLWEQHKDTPIGGVAADAGVIEPELPEMPPAAEPETVEQADPFADEQGIPVDMAPEEARALVLGNYTQDDKATLMKALEFVGASTWLAIPEGKHGVVAARYLKLKGISL